MNISPSFIAYPEAAELVQPTQGAFYHPAVHPQPTAMPLTSLTQPGQDIPTPQFPTQGLRVITSVAQHLQRTPSGPPSLAFERGNGIHQGKGLSYIMTVGPSELHCQGDTLGRRDDVVFAAGFSSVSRVGSGFLPPKRPAPRRCLAPPAASPSGLLPVAVPGRRGG